MASAAAIRFVVFISTYSCSPPLLHECAVDVLRTRYAHTCRCQRVSLSLLLAPSLFSAIVEKGGKRREGGWIGQLLQQRCVDTAAVAIPVFVIILLLHVDFSGSPWPPFWPLSHLWIALCRIFLSLSAESSTGRMRCKQKTIARPTGPKVSYPSSPFSFFSSFIFSLMKIFLFLQNRKKKRRDLASFPP